MYKITFENLETHKVEDTVVTGESYLLMFKDVNNKDLVIAKGSASVADLHSFQECFNEKIKEHLKDDKNCDSCAVKAVCPVPGKCQEKGSSMHKIVLDPDKLDEIISKLKKRG